MENLTSINNLMAAFWPLFFAITVIGGLLICAPTDCFVPFSVISNIWDYRLLVAIHFSVPLSFLLVSCPLEKEF